MGDERPSLLNHNHANATQDGTRILSLRAALARRGAAHVEPIVVPQAWNLRCFECLEATAESLGMRAAVEDTLPGEEELFARYDQRSWRVDSPGTEPVEFYAPQVFGLVRIAREGVPVLWLWYLREVMNGAVCVYAAARERGAFERFVAAYRGIDVAHERRESGLILLEGHAGECRAPSVAVAWDDLVLPRQQRDDIERTVREFFSSRELYRHHRIPYRRGILLAGPPGNGKTTILKAIRTTLSVPVLVASLEECTTDMRHAFQRAAELAPSVLCFEDIDALVGDGPFLSKFLNLLDGLEAMEGTLVVATTNRPDRIDPAIAKRPSRFDRVFAIAPPDRPLRQLYFERHLGADAPEGAPSRLAGRTEGYSVAFLKEVVIQSRLAAVRRGAERLEEDDLDQALQATSEHQRLATRGLEDRAPVGFAVG